MISALPLLAMLLAAHASPGLRGTEGLFDVPTPQTVPPDQMTMSLALRSVVSADGGQINGFPVGLGMGVSRHMDIGVSLHPLDPTLDAGPISVTSLSARLNPLDPSPERRLSVALQAGLERVDLEPGLNALGILGARLGVLHPTLALGPRWYRSAGLGGTVGGGLEIAITPMFSALSEASTVINPRVQAQWQERAGLRLHLGHLDISAWGERGLYQTRSWTGGGVALGLSSAKRAAPPKRAPSPLPPEPEGDADQDPLLSPSEVPAPPEAGTPALRLRIHATPLPGTGEAPDPDTDASTVSDEPASDDPAPTPPTDAPD